MGILRDFMGSHEICYDSNGIFMDFSFFLGKSMGLRCPFLSARYAVFNNVTQQVAP